jgi:hypothetical protein
MSSNACKREARDRQRRSLPISASRDKRTMAEGTVHPKHRKRNDVRHNRQQKLTPEVATLSGSKRACSSSSSSPLTLAIPVGTDSDETHRHSNTLD